MNKGLIMEEKEKLLDSYSKKIGEIGAIYGVETLINYLNANGYLNVKKIRSDFDL